MSHGTYRRLGARSEVAIARSVASFGAPSIRRYGSPWSDGRYKPARAAGSAASSIRCSSPETRPQFGSSKRSDGALPPGGSALGAVAEVHDTVAEPVFLQQLQLGAGVAGECGL